MAKVFKAKAFRVDAQPSGVGELIVVASDARAALELVHKVFPKTVGTSVQVFPLDRSPALIPARVAWNSPVVLEGFEI